MNKPTQLNKAITALMLLMFVVYCSVGVCTSLQGGIPEGELNTATGGQSGHAHHHMAEDPGSSLSINHCGDSESCEWSRNLVAEPVLDAPADFFFAYLLTAVSLIYLLSQILSGGRGQYAFAREQFFQYTYPRLHLQKAVFLN